MSNSGSQSKSNENAVVRAMIKNVRKSAPSEKVLHVLDEYEKQLDVKAITPNNRSHKYKS